MSNENEDTATAVEEAPEVKHRDTVNVEVTQVPGKRAMVAIFADKNTLSEALKGGDIRLEEGDELRVNGAPKQASEVDEILLTEGDSVTISREIAGS